MLSAALGCMRPSSLSFSSIQANPGGQAFLLADDLLSGFALIAISKGLF
jgi:hypothetical protein